MKLNKGNKAEIQSNAVFEGQDARIDPESMDKFWDFFQDPYKNPIGAVVREYVSNSFDSHAEAAFIKANSISDIRTEFPVYNDVPEDEIKKLKQQLQVFDDDAVLVTIDRDDTGHYWATEDFGVGLSEQRVVDVFCSYLKSTKEFTNNAIGAFGIGSKSGLSYTDVVHIRTRYNGVETIYMLRKGEKCPRLDTIHSEPTDKRNGTQIKIYIKEIKKYSWGDPAPETNKFQDACVKQLAYFNNVYFAGAYLDINNEFKLIQTDTWIHNTEMLPFSSLHICLGTVAYPIDWDNLGMEPINVPVALKFEIGELDIIQTREDIKYTSKTVKIVQDRIEEFKKEVIEKWGKDNNNGLMEDFGEYLSKRRDDPYVEYTSEGSYKLTFHLNCIIRDEDELSEYQYKYAPFEAIGFDASSLPVSSFFTDFKINSYVNYSGLKYKDRRTYDALMSKNFPIYRIDGNHDTKKSKYIVHELESSEILFLRKGNKSLSNYRRVLQLDSYPVRKWRDIIKACQKGALNFVLENSKSYAKVKVDPAWIKAQYKDRKAIDRSKMNCYCLDRWNKSFNDIHKVPKNKIPEYFGKKLIVVGTKEEQEELKSFEKIYSNIINNSYTRTMYFMHVGQTNQKHLKILPNYLNIKDIMRHKLFIKHATARYILKKQSFLLGLSLNEIGSLAVKMWGINLEIHSILMEISEYLHHYGRNEYGYVDIINSAYDYVEENNLYDKAILDKVEKASEYFEFFPILKSLDWDEVSSDDLAFMIYRINKGLPIRKHKKLNPNYYVNLNAEEYSWIEGTPEGEKYKKLKIK